MNALSDRGALPGVLLVVIGVVLLAAEWLRVTGTGHVIARYWPVALVVAGGALMISSLRSRTASAAGR